MKCLAPMVDGSDLPFRLLLSNVTHTWTPMYNCKTMLNNRQQAREIVRSIAYEKATTSHIVILQFATNNTSELREAYQLVADNAADYVEINFGCAQSIAQKGRYGSYLLDDLILCTSLIKTLRECAPNKMISVKTRLFDHLNDFLLSAAECGAEMFTLHGRLKGLKLGCFSGPSDFGAVVAAMESLKSARPDVKFVVNGGICTYQQHLHFIQRGADGTMCASFILQNPFMYGTELDADSKLLWRSENDIEQISRKFDCYRIQAQALSGRSIIEQLEAIRTQQLEKLVTLVDENGLPSPKPTNALKPVVYQQAECFVNWPITESLSQDIQLNRMKELEAAADPGVIVCYQDRLTKLNCLASIFDLLDIFEECQRQELESPWSAMLGHVYSLVGRDCLNANADIREFLAKDNKPDYQQRRNNIRALVVEIIQRIFDGTAWPAEKRK